jgi:hypothetical protein
MLPYGSEFWSMIVAVMKPLPAPKVPGSTEFEKFDNFFRAVIAVPKSAIDKEDAKWKQARARKKREKKPQ